MISSMKRQQPLRLVDLARKRRHVLRLGNAARDDLRVTHDAGQRRFQFVRHIGCKFLPLLLGTLALVISTISSTAACHALFSSTELAVSS